MNNITNHKLPLAAGIIAGALLTVASYSLLNIDNKDTTPSSSEAPLHWVAPMDPNYTRDKPGKSPMGMDLIPVYADKSGGIDTGQGTINISPDVVNNLGVRTTKVERKSLHTEIKTVGYVKYNEDQLVHIHPRVEGWIDKLYIKAAGDPVEKGQPLYEIYSPALVNAQEELVLALSRNSQRLIRAAEDRLTALQLPPKAIDELKRSRKVRQNVTFYSPQSGVLDNLNIRQGFFVKPGTSLMSIGSLNEVWVEAEVFEDQSAFVKAGLPVTMTLDYFPGKLWQGRVDYIYPSLDVKTRTLKVRLRFNNDNRNLKPNMFAQVVIHAQAKDNILLIPNESVIRTGSMNRAVLALGDGRYKSVKIKTGRSNDNYTEILLGLNDGDQVVTSAQFLLDSESSKTSDFKRMNHASDTDKDLLAAVWVDAEINTIMPDHRMVNLSHNAIPLWGWPEMTMDFTVVSEVDINKMKPGSKLQVSIKKNISDNYEIVAIKSKESEPSDTVTVDGIINNIMTDHRMLNISREAIEKWNKPAATVDFIVDRNVDISSLTAGMSIQFSFTIDNGTFLITDIKSTY